METTIWLKEDEFEELVDEFGYRYIVDFEMSTDGYECIVLVEPFVELVSHKSRIIRIIAIMVLGQARYKKAVNLLIRALKDKSPVVREYAAISLGDIRDHRAVRPLMITINKDIYNPSSLYAVIATQMILGKDLEHEMAMSLGDPDPKIRVSAGHILGIGEIISDRTKALIRSLDDKNGHVRSVVANALGKVDSIRVIHALIQKIKDGDRRKDVMDNSYYSLKRIKQTFEDALKEIDNIYAETFHSQ